MQGLTGVLAIRGYFHGTMNWYALASRALTPLTMVEIRLDCGPSTGRVTVLNPCRRSA